MLTFCNNKGFCERAQETSFGTLCLWKFALERGCEFLKIKTDDGIIYPIEESVTNEEG